MQQFWLMKSEPDECSIDDALAAHDATVPWTGVRSYQARNFMRDDMKVDDGVLFYHSRRHAAPGDETDLCAAVLVRAARTTATIALVPDAVPTDDTTSYAKVLLVGQRVRLRALIDDDLLELERWWQDVAMMPLQRDQVLPQPLGAGAEMLRRWSANDSPGSVGFSVVATDGETWGT